MADISSRREREKQLYRDEIIRAAESIFYKSGFENSTMDQIAKESGFTKRTLYKYFENKEDLFFGVAYEGFQKLFSNIEAFVEPKENGFEKIHAFIMAYYQFYKDFPDTFLLMNYLGHLKAKETHTPAQEELIKLKSDFFKKFMKMIDEGKADGSIRADIDTVKITYSITFILTGFFNELSMSGKSYSEHFALQEEEFTLFALDLLSTTFLNENINPPAMLGRIE
jgi:AcrR family transcriptional regulator